MLMDGEDKWQQYELIRCEHPEYEHYQIIRDIIDVQKSRAWSSEVSYKPVRNYGLDIESRIDLHIAIDKLSKKQFVNEKGRKCWMVNQRIIEIINFAIKAIPNVK